MTGCIVSLTCVWGDDVGDALSDAGGPWAQASFLGPGVDDDCDDPWDDSGEQGRVDEDELRWLAERERDRDLERDFDRDLDRDLRRERELERLVCSCCCGWPRGGNDRS
ncbi:hypothetical protein MTO96_036143 [Rhipicephalus appendiculatus]